MVNMHFLRAGTGDHSSQEIAASAPRLFPLFVLAVEDIVAFFPDGFGNEGRTFMEYPFIGGFEIPVLFVTTASGIVGSAQSFGDRVTEESMDGST